MMGKPSSIDPHIAVPSPPCSIFEMDTTIYRTHSVDHHYVRAKFTEIAMNIPIIPVDLKNARSSFQDALLKANEIDELASLPPYVIMDRSSELADIPESECREWFYLRLFYLHLRVTLFRPFIIVSAYVELTDNQNHFDQDVLNVLEEGSNHCINAALEFPTMILSIGERIDLYAHNPFWSMYLEPAASVLLFYILHKFTSIDEDMALKIWIALSHSSTYLDSGLSKWYASSRTLVGDTITTLKRIVENTPKGTKLFADPAEFHKIFFMQAC